MKAGRKSVLTFSELVKLRSIQAAFGKDSPEEAQFWEQVRVSAKLRRADSYQFFQGHYRRLEEIYKNEAHQYRDWLYFGLNYGCKTPTEMKFLIYDLVKKIGELEHCKRT